MILGIEVMVFGGLLSVKRFPNPRLPHKSETRGHLMGTTPYFSGDAISLQAKAHIKTHPILDRVSLKI